MVKVMKNIVRYFNVAVKNESPVDVDGVHGCLAELGDLEVLLLDVLLVLEVSPAVGDNSPSISHADKVGLVALKLKLSSTFLLLTDPSLTEMKEVRLEQGWINPEVLHVGSKSRNVQGSHPHLAKRVLVPLVWVVVQGPDDFQCEKNIS